MPTTLFSHARSRIVLVLLMVAGLVVPVGATDGAQAQSADVYWASDFGNGSAAGFDSLGDGASSTVWNDRDRGSFGTFEGRDAWRIDLPEDQRTGTKVRARFQDLGFEPQAGVRLQYDVFIASESALGLDLKLPGIGSAPASESLWSASSGGSKPADSASVRMHTRPSGHWGVSHPYLDVYAYANRGGGKTFEQWGLYWRLSEGLNATGSSKQDEFRIPIGEWFTITVDAEMNTPGARDGQLRVWLDGRKGVDLTDMEWVTDAPYVWTQTMFETFYNNGTHPAASVRLANMTMSPIGGPGSSPVEPTPEPAPTPEPTPEPEPAPAPEPPVAAFSYSPRSPQPGDTVTFDASGSQRATDWVWDDAAPGAWPLGDGETMAFTFQHAGTKYVRLVVTDESGRTDTIMQPIEVAVQPLPDVAPPGRDRWTFDGGMQGWGAGQSSDRVQRERSVTHEGSGALRGRTRFPTDATGVLRFRSDGGDRDWSADGGELGAWIYVPKRAGGSNWQARIEIQNGSDYRYARGELTMVTPGTWTYVSHDFGSTLQDVYRVAVQVQAWDVGGYRDVYLDTVRQEP